MLVLAGGMSALAARFSFCVSGPADAPAPKGPVEVIRPGTRRQRPPSVYLGQESCLQGDQCAGALAALGIRRILNLTGRPCPGQLSKGRSVIQMDGSNVETAQAAAVKLGRQRAPCLVYGPRSELAVALYLLTSFPRVFTGSEIVIAFVTQRLPGALFDTTAMTALRGCSANTGDSTSQVAPPPPPPAEEPSAPPQESHPADGPVPFAHVKEVCAKFQKRNRRAAEASLKTIKVVLNNVLEHPTDPKFRRLKGDNKRVKTEILAHPEAVELLRLAGFIRDGEDLVLPPTNPRQGVRDLLDHMP